MGYLFQPQSELSPPIHNPSGHEGLVEIDGFDYDVDWIRENVIDKMEVFSPSGEFPYGSKSRNVMLANAPEQYISELVDRLFNFIKLDKKHYIGTGVADFAVFRKKEHPTDTKAYVARKFAGAIDIWHIDQIPGITCGINIPVVYHPSDYMMFKFNDFEVRGYTYTKTALIDIKRIHNSMSHGHDRYILRVFLSYPTGFQGVVKHLQEVGLISTPKHEQTNPENATFSNEWDMQCICEARPTDWKPDF